MVYVYSTEATDTHICSACDLVSSALLDVRIQNLIRKLHHHSRGSLSPLTNLLDAHGLMVFSDRKGNHLFSHKSKVFNSLMRALVRRLCLQFLFVVQGRLLDRHCPLLQQDVLERPVYRMLEAEHVAVAMDHDSLCKCYCLSCVLALLLWRVSLCRYFRVILSWRRRTSLV